MQTWYLKTCENFQQESHFCPNLIKPTLACLTTERNLKEKFFRVGNVEKYLNVFKCSPAIEHCVQKIPRRR